jgi:quercetin dioxygenase-like cupin family protein
VVRYRDATPPIDCPYGHVQRIVSGGVGGVANVHVVTVTEGGRHSHQEYDEVYYVLKGEGTITLAAESHQLRPGAVVVIPAGIPHALKALPGQQLEFVIFGTPPVPITDERARPRQISPDTASQPPTP